MGLVKEALAEAKITPQDLSCIAFTKVGQVLHAKSPCSKVQRLMLKPTGTSQPDVTVCIDDTRLSYDNEGVVLLPFAGPRNGRPSRLMCCCCQDAFSAVGQAIGWRQPLCGSH